MVGSGHTAADIHCRLENKTYDRFPRARDAIQKNTKK